VLPETINFQSATNSMDSLSLKLGLELWQLFTVLTVIFSLASSFIWIGLVNPRSTIDQINQIDRAKALVYNQFQQDMVNLKAIEIGQATLNMDTCEAKQDVDNIENFKNINLVASESKAKINNELGRIDKNKSLFEDKTNISKTFKSYIEVLNEVESGSARLKDFQIKKIDLLNKMLLMCQDSNGVITNKDIADSIDEIKKFAPSDKINEQLNLLKVNIADAVSDLKIKSTLSEINSIQSTVIDIVTSLKPKLNEFEINTKQVEIWERQAKEQNPNISIKALYIYDA
jgi:hypothetical protein